MVTSFCVIINELFPERFGIRVVADLKTSDLYSKGGY